ncbi:hypothetical protein ACPW96_03980 [Micromonospora sp. DT81.3]|uniref:hypothetical protein n=1 Tax=Micromonospora sp. DT81.3 TaxID=3416523 RepID=UPI003CF76B13
MDGSPSASNPDPESFQRITHSRLSDAERELNDLRARAYGPASDIDADPAAMARLIELEAAHAGAPAPVTVTQSVGSRAAEASPSLWQRATATRSRAWFVVGSTVVIAILIYAAARLLAPQPDATLQPTAVQPPNSPLIQTLDGFGEVADTTTLLRFEQYHDVNVWSVENSLGSNCLIAWDSAGSGRFEFECLPPGRELALHLNVAAESNDGFGEWLPGGSVVSLYLRGDTVDVFVHTPPAST